MYKTIIIFGFWPRWSEHAEVEDPVDDVYHREGCREEISAELVEAAHGLRRVGVEARPLQPAPNPATHNLIEVSTGEKATTRAFSLLKALARAFTMQNYIWMLVHKYQNQRADISIFAANSA